MDPKLDQLADEELARRSQTGCLASFEALVYRYENRVYSFVARSCHNNSAAQEVTQNTFVRAFQAVSQFHPDRSFAGWLFTIARRKCIDYYRSWPLTAQEAKVELTEDVTPHDLLAQNEEHKNLWDAARRQLPQNQFQALWLRYVEDLDVAEIARILGKTKTGVKVMLFRARQTLGRTLSAQSTPVASPRDGLTRSAATVNSPKPSQSLGIKTPKPSPI